MLRLAAGLTVAVRAAAVPMATGPFGVAEDAADLAGARAGGAATRGDVAGKRPDGRSVEDFSLQ